MRSPNSQANVKPPEPTSVVAVKVRESPGSALERSTEAITEGNGNTWMVTESVAETRSSSVTAHVAVFEPAVSYAWLAVSTAAPVPSPKSQANAYGGIPSAAVHVKSIESPTSVSDGREVLVTRIGR